MKILHNVKKIPGGLMMVPLLLAAAINTIFPQLVSIGSYTTALFTGAGTPTVVGLSLFFLGTGFELKEASEATKRGTVLLVMKVLSGALVGLIINLLFGNKGIFGVSVLAIVSAATNSNNSLYMTLVNEYGDEKDISAQGVLNFNTGPFFALIILGAAGAANIPLMSLLSSIGPLLAGIILGNLDDDIRRFCRPGITLIIPFLGFCLGSSINLKNIIDAGFEGIILTFIVIVGTGIPLVLADRFINKRPGYAGAALSSTAGNAAVTPSAVALIDPKFHSVAASATTQVAAAVIFTIILTPIVTVFVTKYFENSM